MEIKSLVEQAFWDHGYEGTIPYLAKDKLSDWLCRFYFKNKDLTALSAFEIGCFPGRYLAHFAINKMQINGIDQTPGIAEMEKWVQANGYSYGKFYTGDLLSTGVKERYDLVCSFGFIEHFDNYQYIIQKHIDLNKENGTIIITTPNFSGWGQYLLHLFFDTKNLKRHNLKAMNPEQWAKYLMHQGYTIEHKSYFGKFEFWFDSDVGSLREKLRSTYMRYILPEMKRRIRFDSKFFSPFCGIIATRSN